MKAYSLIILTSVVLLTSCYKEEFIEAGAGLADWTTTTHASTAEPNYNIVFKQNNVNRIDIVINADDWIEMQTDLESIIGSETSTGPPQGPAKSATVADADVFSDETPMYVPCELYFNNLEWYNVGIRYKGNSSLSNTGGVEKLPFRLEFNYFEDIYPEITGQKFYGFQQLSLSSSYDDASVSREKTATDLFREFGVPAPYSAFYEVYIDYGDGSVYYGLYTIVEVVFDTMLDKQFGNSSGNCYKPENDGATFASSLFNTSDFTEKSDNNSTYEDVTAMYNALHATTRTSDPTAWKAGLEATFDVDGFLKYLAVNSVIQNWDTYGNMTHNYYLYNDPSDGLLKWIPWDNNEAFQDGKMTTYDLDYTNLSESNWPLIAYILSIDSYKATYKEYISDFVKNVFEPASMSTLYTNQQSLISESVEKESSPYTFVDDISVFNTAIDNLINHCSERNTIVQSYLSE